MELKPYQQQVITDLKIFLEKIQKYQKPNPENYKKLAFEEFWAEKGITPEPNKPITPYQNNIPNAPHVCVKVPTAGGKTFIACNALRPIFEAYKPELPKVVVWLTPSRSILEQTAKNLRNPQHPYRQKISTHFQNKVEIFEKDQLLQGNGFTQSSVFEQLNILVLSNSSLKAKNKEDRKAHQENGNLQFQLEKEDVTLMNVLRELRPIVIIDESHKAETELSAEMLQHLNPRFVLDLTATPRQKSNIISFVDNRELKKENMVKLPVIVHNDDSKNDVIANAIQLQKKLEEDAKEEYKKTKNYIRPIVLFQAQSKNQSEERVTFPKIKEKLIKDLKIPEAHIKIKTAEIDELKGLDLLSPTCEVRYIITVNALNEGWDCPFAYILASLADKSSVIDVTQILGRILRLPYTRQHSNPALNFSYVLTASSKFQETLQKIVEGLKVAGFSEKEHKVLVTSPTDEKPKVVVEQMTLDNFFGNVENIAQNLQTQETNLDDLDANYIQEKIKNQQTALDAIFNEVKETHQTIQKEINNPQIDNNLPADLKKMQNTQSLKDVFKEKALQIKLPQFFIQVQKGTLFNQNTENQLLQKDNLLKDFKLSNADTHINFDYVESNIYKVDLDDSKKDYTPTYSKVNNIVNEYFETYFASPEKKEGRIETFGKIVLDNIGKQQAINDTELKKYIQKVLESLTDSQLSDFSSKQYTYCDKIKQKIEKLCEEFGEKIFKQKIDTDQITILPTFSFPLEIAPTDTAKDFPKSLYQKEGKINGFEEKVINEVANLENVLFWTRNIERKGFCINGFINHYPDFIIVTKKGKIVILETKGDHLDAQNKITLGNIWASKAGNEYRYCLVYEERNVNGAYTTDDFLKFLKEL